MPHEGGDLALYLPEDPEFTLSPNTTYAFFISDSGLGSAQRLISTSEYSTQIGHPWSVDGTFTNVDGFWWSLADPSTLTIKAQLIPEPSSIAFLAGTGAVAALLCARRKKAS